MKKLFSVLLSLMFALSFNFNIYANFEISTSPMSQKFIDYLNTPSLYSNDSSSGYIPEPYELPYVEKNQTYDLPSTYNISSQYNIQNPKNFISPIKDQGQDGVCWAFSTIGVMESSLLKQENLTQLDTYDFSENHMRHALSKDGNNPLGFERKHDGGGNFKMGLAYLTRGEINGPVWEKDDVYEYNQPVRDVNITSAIGAEDFYVTKSITLADLPEKPTQAQKNARINEIKQLVMDYGSVTLSYYSDNNYYDDPYKPTSYYYNGDISNSNHAVAIVGWDDNYNKDNFKYKPENNGAFLIKNSWGIRGNLDGYFYMSYEDKFALSGINAIASVESREFYDNLYEYDPFGNIGGSIGFGLDTNAYANVFECISENEILTAISTNTIIPNIYLKFFVSTDDSFKNLKEVNIQGYGSKTDRGYQIPDTGYITFKLESPIELKSNKFAIAIEVYNPNNKLNTIPMERNTNGYLSNATQNAGESFMAPDVSYLVSNRNIYDLASQYQANACIKAFTKNVGAEQSYTINIASDIEGGVIEANLSEAAEGTDIKLNVIPDDGMRLKENSLVYNDGTNKYIIKNNTFKMPATNVTIYAEFEKIPYNIFISHNIDGGTVESSHLTAAEGTDIIVTVTPNKGMQLVQDSLKYDDGIHEYIINNNTFKMPASDVTIYAEFEEAPYNITIDNNIKGGTIKSDISNAKAGTEINLTILPDEGMRLKENSLKYNDGTKDYIISNNTFKMPASSVTVYAEFEKIPYNINIDKSITGGSVEVNYLTATEGTDIVVTVKADEGMQLKENSLVYRDGTDEHIIYGNTFKMPASDITIYAEFEKIPSKNIIIEITTATKDAQIYYTLDGTTPTKQSTKYTDKIKKSLDDFNQSTLTIKAIAFKESFKDSDIAVKTVPIISKSLYTVDKSEELEILKQAIQNANTVLKDYNDGNVDLNEIIDALNSVSSAIVNYSKVSKVSTPVIKIEFK